MRVLFCLFLLRRGQRTSLVLAIDEQPSRIGHAPGWARLQLCLEVRQPERGADARREPAVEPDLDEAGGRVRVEADEDDRLGDVHELLPVRDGRVDRPLRRRRVEVRRRRFALPVRLLVQPEGWQRTPKNSARFLIPFRSEL